PDRAVVEQAQVVVASVGKRLVRLADVYLAAEEGGEDAAVMPGRVVLEPSLEALEEQLRDALALALPGDRAVLLGDHVAGGEGGLGVDGEGGAGLVDVGGLAHQPRRLVYLGLAPAGHDHDLDPGPVAGLEAARLRQREGPHGVAVERAAAAEQGAVEV